MLKVTFLPSKQWVQPNDFWERPKIIFFNRTFRFWWFQSNVQPQNPPSRHRKSQQSKIRLKTSKLPISNHWKRLWCLCIATLPNLFIIGCNNHQNLFSKVEYQNIGVFRPIFESWGVKLGFLRHTIRLESPKKIRKSY